VPSHSPARRDFYCVVGIIILALAVRWGRMSQSLWYDEMTTVTEYLVRPWQRTLTPHAGEYVPNNHVLHTVLVKLVYPLVTDGGDPMPPAEAVLRLPALVASLLLPIALAWPLRKSDPLLAGVAAVTAAVNPWLVAFGTEARGYSLLLLLGIVATALLPAGRPWRSWGYAASLAAAICTVPLAVLLVPAHAIAVAVTRCSPWRRWALSTGTGLAIAALLYLPMRHGLIAYYRHPYAATMSYRRLLDWLPRYAWTGERLPRDGSTGSIFWAVPVLTIIMGSVLGWQRPAVRPLLVTLLAVTALGLGLAAVDPAAVEVRFIPWVAPLFCLAIAAALTTVPGKPARIAGGLGFAAILFFSLQLDWRMLPDEPIREGIALADQRVPPDRRIVVLYLGARESIFLYAFNPPRSHVFVPADDETMMETATREAVQSTGYLPWVLIYFEQQAKDRDAEPGPAHGMWSDLVRHYHIAARLPARLGAVTLYAPDQGGPVRVPQVISAAFP
jgi:hypothetical protein